MFYVFIFVIQMVKQGYILCDLNFVQDHFSWVKMQPIHEGDSIAHTSVDKTSQ